MSFQMVGDRRCALITMPEPERSPEAYFIGIVLLTKEPQQSRWPRDLKARVFTLEKMAIGVALVCELLRDNGRMIHSAVSLPGAAAFLGVLESIVTQDPVGPTLPTYSADSRTAAPAPIAPALPETSATPPPPPAAPPLDPVLARMLNEPFFIADPVYAKGNYLSEFGAAAFQAFLSENRKSHLVPRIATASNTPGMVMLRADNLACWTIDLEEISKKGVSGKNEFIDRVKDPVRRPPPEMAAFTMTQHILRRGVAKIQIADGPNLPGQYQVSSLKTVGWYVALLELP